MFAPGEVTLKIDLPRLRSWFGVGVAGNFAGHLEQAGEAGDFVNVAAEASAPKGLFPFYAPGHDSFLSVFPLSHETIALPASAEAAASLQAEPEVGLACEVRAPARKASLRASSGSTDRTSSSRRRTTALPASCAARASCTPTASTAR